jgi:hypothetical protein
LFSCTCSSRWIQQRNWRNSFLSAKQVLFSREILCRGNSSQYTEFCLNLRYKFRVSKPKGSASKRGPTLKLTTTQTLRTESRSVVLLYVGFFWVFWVVWFILNCSEQNWAVLISLRGREEDIIKWYYNVDCTFGISTQGFVIKCRLANKRRWNGLFNLSFY